jgi:hypothetical protein
LKTLAEQQKVVSIMESGLQKRRPGLEEIRLGSHAEDYRKEANIIRKSIVQLDERIAYFNELRDLASELQSWVS